MGEATVTAETIGVGWTIDRAQRDSGTEAVGGFPDLIDAGSRVGDLEVTERPTFAAARHPRSAVGYDTEGGEVWIIVVDGRQAPHSAGMTLPELAALNRPSDVSGERAVVNALALVQNPRGCGI
jgi:hypothetical protein